MEPQITTQTIEGKITSSMLSGAEKPLLYKPGFDLDFVKRLLGSQKKNGLSRTTRQRLQLQQERLLDVIRPRIIWQECAIAHIDSSGVTLANGITLQSRKMIWAMKNAKSLICFIATVGSQIDREIESLLDNGELAHGYIADALGSGAVENLADRFHTDIAKKVAKTSQSVGLRFSPGYCDWLVTEQQKLFTLLDSDAVGVTLTDSCLMAPRKSISGVFGIFDLKDAPVDRKKHNPCRLCSKKDCIARRVEAVPPSYH